MKNLSWWLLAGLCIPVALVAQTPAEDALDEYNKALHQTPNLENGREIYRKCAVCHDPEGWGRESGVYPQIAGQHANVIIKQLADIRAGNRGNPMMYPFTLSAVLKDAQAIADVAAYVSQLPMKKDIGQGSESRIERGREIYREYCAECHGDNGQGDNKEHIPLLYGQHYQYLVRQFNWIRIGRRKNADQDMVEQIENFTAGDMYDVLSYVSTLPIPEEKRAPEGWLNPDFTHYSRDSDDLYRSKTQRLRTGERDKGFIK